MIPANSNFVLENWTRNLRDLTVLVLSRRGSVPHAEHCLHLLDMLTRKLERAGANEHEARTQAQLDEYREEYQYLVEFVQSAVQEGRQQHCTTAKQGATVKQGTGNTGKRAVIVKEKKKESSPKQVES